MPPIPFFQPIVDLGRSIAVAPSAARQSGFSGVMQALSNPQSYERGQVVRSIVEQNRPLIESFDQAIAAGNHQAAKQAYANLGEAVRHSGQGADLESEILTPLRTKYYQSLNVNAETAPQDVVGAGLMDPNAQPNEYGRTLAEVLKLRSQGRAADAQAYERTRHGDLYGNQAEVTLDMRDPRMFAENALGEQRLGAAYNYRQQGGLAGERANTVIVLRDPQVRTEGARAGALDAGAYRDIEAGNFDVARRNTDDALRAPRVQTEQAKAGGYDAEAYADIARGFVDDEKAQTVRDLREPQVATERARAGELDTRGYANVERGNFDRERGQTVVDLRQPQVATERARAGELDTRSYANVERGSLDQKRGVTEDVLRDPRAYTEAGRGANQFAQAEDEKQSAALREANRLTEDALRDPRVNTEIARGANQNAQAGAAASRGNVYENQAQTIDAMRPGQVQLQGERITTERERGAGIAAKRTLTDVQRDAKQRMIAPDVAAREAEARRADAAARASDATARNRDREFQRGGLTESDTDRLMTGIKNNLGFINMGDPRGSKEVLQSDLMEYNRRAEKIGQPVVTLRQKPPTMGANGQEIPGELYFSQVPGLEPTPVPFRGTQQEDQNKPNVTVEPPPPTDAQAAPPQDFGLAGSAANTQLRPSAVEDVYKRYPDLIEAIASGRQIAPAEAAAVFAQRGDNDPTTQNGLKAVIMQEAQKLAERRQQEELSRRSPVPQPSPPQ